MVQAILHAVEAGPQAQHNTHDQSSRESTSLSSHVEDSSLQTTSTTRRKDLLLPFELLAAICFYLNADCLRAFALASTIFADASLTYRFHSVTIPSQLRAEELLATKNFSTRIAQSIRHLQLSARVFYPSQLSKILIQEETHERAQDFLIWTFENVLNQLNNLTCLSFEGIIFNTASETTLSKLKTIASIPLPSTIRHVTLKNCELSSTSYNLLFARFTHVRSLAIDDSTLFTGDHKPLNSLPELTDFTVTRATHFRVLRFSDSQRLDMFIDVSTVKRFSINVSRYLGASVLGNSVSIGHQLNDATLVEELELNVDLLEEDVHLFSFLFPLRTLPNLRVLKLGTLLNYSCICPLFDTMTSSNLYRVEGECDHRLHTEESLSTLKEVDKAIFKLLERLSIFPGKFQLVMKVKSWGFTSEVVIARLRPAFSKLRECVVINVVS
ncbi:hypothetical protein C8Q75DRAFT_412963 [Abortiporus biennis]|nr:hypothetical protein C8Q75DRAFT_412963 [Abortiporus biennis]